MKDRKLNLVIKLLDEHFGKPFDYKKNEPEILDVLIATKLSQNTTDKSAYTAFKNLKNKFKNWEEVSSASEKEIKDCIKVCGLANTKSKDIKQMLKKMKSSYGSLDVSFLKSLDDAQVYDELLQYRGIGIKTISCVLIFALGRDAFPVDTHVHRVLNRLGIVKQNSPLKTFAEIVKKIPEGKMYVLHANLIKFGRNICRAKIPLCGICFLYGLCEFKNKKNFRDRNAVVPENNFIILEHI